MQAFFNLSSKTRVLITVLGIMLFLPAGRHGEDFVLIDTPITSRLFEKHEYLFSDLSIKISPDDVFIHENVNFFAIRAVNAKLCQSDSCLTFIVNRCDRDRCPHATALVVNRFYRYIIPSVILGELVRFPTTVEGNFTTIMINSRFVAAVQGL